MGKLKGPVGANQANIAGDVSLVQSLLNNNIHLLVPLKPIVVDGRYSDHLSTLIYAFQERVAKLKQPDGVVSPNGQTLRYLTSGLPPAPSTKVTGLADADFADAARRLSCEVAAIKAVAKTETSRKAFDDKGRPAILYERHLFHKHTGGKFDKTNPTLSNSKPSYTDGSYGKFSEQYTKLEAAAKLDEKAAYKSTSWGMFQILGENHKQAGFDSVESFVAAMRKSEGDHLNAFINFVKNDPRLLKALQDKNWAQFARIYNGKDYRANKYDEHMRDNYQALLPKETAAK